MKTKILLQKPFFGNSFCKVFLFFLLFSNIYQIKANPQMTVNVTNIRSSSFRVSWSAVSGTYKYEIYIGKGICNNSWGCIQWLPKTEVNAATLTLVVEGLQYGSPDVIGERQRFVHIYARNIKDEKLDDISTTVYLLDNPPRDVSTSNSTKTSFDVNWMKNSFDHRVTVQYDNGGVKQYVAGYPKTIDKSLSKYNVTGLQPGTKYYILVDQWLDGWAPYTGNGNDSKGWSERVEINTSTICNQPVAIEASDIKPNEFMAHWNKTTGADSYKLYVKEKATGKSVYISNETSSLMAGAGALEPGTQYEYQVTALNEGGESAKSNLINVTTSNLPKPVAYEADNITINSFRARWSSVPNASGYKLQLNDGNVYTYYETTGIVYTLTGLKPNFSCKYSVRALFKSNTEFSGFSNEISVKTLNAPSGLDCVSITTNGANFSWHPFSGATGYKLWILSTEIEGTNPAGYSGKSLGNITQVSVNGLLSGHSYKCYITAITANGETAPSASVDFNTVPIPPIEIKASEVSKSSFNINWQKVLNASNYKLTITKKGNAVPVSGYNQKVITADKTSFFATGFDPNTEYIVFLVTQKNGFTSAESEQITVKTLQTGYKLTLNSNPLAGGNVEGAGEFAPNTSVTAKATPNAGYEFVNWTEGSIVVSTSATYSFTLSTNRTLTANFKQRVNCTLNVSANPAAGGKAPGTGGYWAGTELTLNALPNAGYEFVNWTEGATIVSTTITYKFTITSNRTLVANFRQVATGLTLSLNENPTTGGDATGGGIYSNGTSVTIKATPFSGYEFVNWTEGASVVSTLATYTFSLSANRTLTANFKASIINYSLSLSANPSIGGTASGGGSFINGKSVMVSATPQTGYEFENWTENGVYVSSTANYTFNLNGNRNLTANFRKQTQTTHTLSINSVPFTAGSATGSGSYASGTKVIVSALPNRGYDFVNWTKAGVIVSTSVTYNFDINENTNLIANFSVRTVSKTFEKSGINVYPNPVTDVLNVSGIKTGISIGLYSVTGKLVLQKVMVNEIEKIDFTNLTPGVYFMKSKDTSLPAVKIIRK